MSCLHFIQYTISIIQRKKKTENRGKLKVKLLLFSKITVNIDFKFLFIPDKGNFF